MAQERVGEEAGKRREISHDDAEGKKKNLNDSRDQGPAAAGIRNGHIGDSIVFPMWPFGSPQSLPRGFQARVARRLSSIRQPGLVGGMDVVPAVFGLAAGLVCLPRRFGGGAPHPSTATAVQQPILAWRPTHRRVGRFCFDFLCLRLFPASASRPSLDHPRTIRTALATSLERPSRHRQCRSACQPAPSPFHTAMPRQLTDPRLFLLDRHSDNAR
ncbi:hypothetical protein B0T14DRAFT_172473 [Immersiella caudata]|uniref:Uncharacterized protein n=1 Tax=Immersiella caudata TaxID=314043 RepID=A0AA39WXC4_9PEZI|nr:hypothetical protein B0T14DRAFT_172473 [Immersiella caudata]